MRVGHTKAIELLRASGSSELTLSPLDSWIAACLRENADAASGLAQSIENLPALLQRTDHQWVVRAARQGKFTAAQLLIDGGASADIADDDGEYALPGRGGWAD